MATITSKLTELKGVGKIVGDKLAAMGLSTVNDLIGYFPRAYDDYSHIVKIIDLQPGLASLVVRFSEIKERRVRRGLHITEAVANDDSGRVKLVWFNQPYRAKSIKSQKKYFISGEYGLRNQRLQITNPRVELVDSVSPKQTAKILATYRESGVVNSLLLRKLIYQIVPLISTLPETLPQWVIKKHRLMSYADALLAIHQPSSQNELLKARNRLAFEELFVVIMASQQIKKSSVKIPALPVLFNETAAIDFVQHLSFKLTDAQRKTVWQIYKDINSTEPMNRLVEGDVGSGKTVVAAMAALMVIEAGLQVALIAPTELLAKQHFDTLKKLFDHTKYVKRIYCLTGGLKAKDKTTIKKMLVKNKISLIVGTHSLIQEDVDWHKLGLIIVDEQHRFGVAQRQKLLLKAGHMPHVLCLTATPIPRSLALTVYGELDISILDQAPSQRAGVETVLVSPNSKLEMYQAATNELQAGRQVYVVCPLINESEGLQVANAEKTYQELKNHQFKNWRVGLLHGRLKASEKDKIMRAFVAKKIDVLVSTTVIEVGVDVANASVMIIEGADRFGLAQLHQLRGRVGRAEYRGYCYLVMSDSQAPSKRMQAIASTSDGFKLAELDLEIRGPGAIYGMRQHGDLDLRIAKLSDTKLISETRSAVQEFFKRQENLLKYRQIAAKVRQASKLTYLN